MNINHGGHRNTRDVGLESHTSSAGKGDHYRPVDPATYEENFDAIKWPKKTNGHAVKTKRGVTIYYGKH